MIDHIAILTESQERLNESLPGFCRGLEPELQPAEGTLERYVLIDGLSGLKLLLMEPVADGPYSSALSRRGSGLHHIALLIKSFEAFFESDNGLRLLLHPYSIQSIEYGTLWLCRPGIPFLVELTECDKLDDSMDEFTDKLQPGPSCVITIPVNESNRAEEVWQLSAEVKIQTGSQSEIIVEIENFSPIEFNS
ncbi:MAG: hypothetical protein CVV64_04295 [Candidatus Wallbacteria bacterium HGW-Wallbacteria-1]|jgi:hypothetical protein|uniref:VOC domain-containing protein n=1 Tax=Candidatus Wallbacteria bacterium HGW-Wallbacteria-1 TaxID=2013854 RepID=A0A2N1PRN0_9BACT|nr:MAG: hypothetical protein CVV64_04295 [Candidatus Wallbacteria bacterium HGW-Wallbacteria-1]